MKLTKEIVEKASGKVVYRRLDELLDAFMQVGEIILDAVEHDKEVFAEVRHDSDVDESIVKSLPDGIFNRGKIHVFGTDDTYIFSVETFTADGIEIRTEEGEAYEIILLE